MEFIGTLFLVLAIGLTGNPLAIGMALAVLVYMGGHISGAHYNPAVTLAVWMRGKLKGNLVPGYMLAQLLGAIVAAWCIVTISGEAFTPAPGPGVLSGTAVFVEILFTFLLASTILVVATGKAFKGNYIYGLAIGLALAVGVYAGGAISGGAYNPAVGLGPLLFSALQGGSFAVAWIYIVGPLVGGALAAWVFKYLNPKG